MSRCLDKRFEEQLHAYELGMLSDSDREKLEIHLVECEACFENILSLDGAATLMRHDPDIRQNMLRQETPDRSGAQSPAKRHSRSGTRFWLTLVPSSAIAIAALLVLVFKPWQIEIRPTQEAIAAENRLAIMCFDNLADPGDDQRLGQIAANLLITDLSESQYVEVVSSQRLFDILKLLGKQDVRVMDRGVATSVAEQARARWMLMGSILQTEPHLVLTTQLVEVASGNAVASQRVIGTEGEEIFSLVDRLTVEIKSDLSLPLGAHEEVDPQVADVTTHSSEAYRHYLEGVDFESKFFHNEAVQSFSRSLTLDSTFAMAYYQLALLSSGQQHRELIARAVQYAEGVSQRERWYIIAQAALTDGNDSAYVGRLRKILKRYPEEKEAYFRLGRHCFNRREYEEAIANFRQVVGIDPLSKTAYNQLAYSYSAMDDFENSIASINEYIRLAPEEPNPYDSRGDIYANFGYLDKAAESYRDALNLKPDFTNSLANLGMTYLHKGEYESADSCFRALISDGTSGWRDAGRLYLSFIPVRKGKLEDALRILDEGIARSMADSSYDRKWRLLGDSHKLKSAIYLETGRFDLAIKEIETCMDLAAQVDSANVYTYGSVFAKTLALGGDIRKAEKIAEQVRLTIESQNPLWVEYSHRYADGWIAYAREDWDSAAAAFEKAVETSENFAVHFALGRAYLKSGRLAEAVAKFDELLSKYNVVRLFWGISSVKTHYYLGLAYEQSHWYDRAIKQYELFLSTWKDADPGLAAVADAKERLARLKNKS